MSRYGIHELFEYLDASAACEELDLPNGEFVARNGKSFKKAMVVYTVLAICMGLLILFLNREAWDIAVFVLSLGALMLMLSLTLLTYRCTVNKISLKEEYWILCFKCKKEIFWKDIKYKKLKYGRTNSITFYNANKKRLMSFDASTVGFSRICKMAKRSSILKFKNKLTSKEG